MTLSCLPHHCERLTFLLKLKFNLKISIQILSTIPVSLHKMVNTRSQARSSIPVFMSKASRNDRVSDTESECSIPDLLTRDQIDELDNENLIHSEQHSDRITIDQRFSSMNRQINELTGLVLALTEKLSSNHGEGNDQNTVIDKANVRSDMVTGVPQTNFLANPHPTQQSTSR